MEMNKFNAFDKVLIRQGNRRWKADLYSHYEVLTSQHKMVSAKCVGCRDILPFDKYSHLLGTTDEPDEEVKLKEGEWIMVSDFIDGLKGKCCSFGKFIGIKGESFIKESYQYKEGLTFKYAIRFKDFDPYNMEVTKAKILCIKDGKVMRYKG